MQKEKWRYYLARDKHIQNKRWETNRTVKATYLHSLAKEYLVIARKSYEESEATKKPISIDGGSGTWSGAVSNPAYMGDNIWHHVVSLRRNDTTYLYVDGVKINDFTTLVPYFNNSIFSFIIIK